MTQEKIAYSEQLSCQYCGGTLFTIPCIQCGGTLRGYPSKDEGFDAIPFHHEGVLWVFCMICEEAVKVSDSNPISRSLTYRICKAHNEKQYKSIDEGKITALKVLDEKS